MPKRKALFICGFANKKCQEKVWKRELVFWEEGKGAVAKLNFATAFVVFIFKHNYLQLNTLLPDKSTIFAAIFAFPQTISLSNAKKSSNARTHFCWLGITKHSAQLM